MFYHDGIMFELYRERRRELIAEARTSESMRSTRWLYGLAWLMGNGLISLGRWLQRPAAAHKI